MNRIIKVCVLVVISFVIGGIVGHIVNSKNTVEVITKEFVSSSDMISETQKVQNILGKATLKQLQKPQEVYVLVWTDDTDNYSGIYIDGQIIALQKSAVSSTNAPTPTPTSTP